MRYLKLKNLKAGQYIDDRELLLQASFQILEDFVESKGFKQVSWFYQDEWSHKRHDDIKKLLKVYHWWKFRRPARIDPYSQGDPHPEFNWLDDEWHTPVPMGVRIEFDKMKKAYPEHFKWLHEQGKMEDDYEKEDQAMLRRLVDVRLIMWT